MSMYRGLSGARKAHSLLRATVSCHARPPLVIAVRHHFNKDFKPGPYPETPEARKAAAKKYNLPEEWYEPHPDNGEGYGDYPKLPDISQEARDDFYPWDYPEYKRNFDEPRHAQEDMITDARVNLNFTHTVPVHEQFAWFIGAIILSYALFFYFEDYDRKITPPVLPKQLPSEGVHYSF